MSLVNSASNSLSNLAGILSSGRNTPVRPKVKKNKRDSSADAALRSFAPIPGTSGVGADEYDRIDRVADSDFQSVFGGDRIRTTWLG